MMNSFYNCKWFVVVHDELLTNERVASKNIIYHLPPLKYGPNASCWAEIWTNANFLYNPVLVD